MLGSGPTLEKAAVAVGKAVAVRRAGHDGDGTAGAIAERVTGITLPPLGVHHGWWLVGRVTDDIEGAEFSVWYVPGERRGGIGKQSAI